MEGGESRLITDIRPGDVVPCFRSTAAHVLDAPIDVTSSAQSADSLPAVLDRSAADSVGLAQHAHGQTPPGALVGAAEARHPAVDEACHPRSGGSDPGYFTTYNFTVEKYHTYIAGGYRVHNDSLWFFDEIGNFFVETYETISEAFSILFGNDSNISDSAGTPSFFDTLIDSAIEWVEDNAVIVDVVQTLITNPLAFITGEFWAPGADDTPQPGIIDILPTWLTDPNQAASGETHETDSSWQDGQVGEGLTADPGWLNEAISANANALLGIFADNWRPGNQQINPADSINISAYISEPFVSYASTLASTRQLVNLDHVAPAASSLATIVANLQSPVSNGALTVPIDPLVIDLNNDGTILVDLNDQFVLFDIDNDVGGYKETTSWIADGDAFVVLDRDGNDEINNITEIFSPQFGNAPGDSSERFATGFEALAAYDLNGDGRLSAAEAEAEGIQLWVDDGNANTEEGELRSFSDYGIDWISLAYQPGNGTFVPGGEILGTGEVKVFGETLSSAYAVDLLADPFGHNVVTTTYGVDIHSEVGSSSIVLKEDESATSIDLSATSFSAAYGNSYDNVLIGNDQDNWLVGGPGSDVLRGGAGDDVLVVDWEDKLSEIDGGAGVDIIRAAGPIGLYLNLSDLNVEGAIGGSGTDVFIAGGGYSTFMRGGGGDDMLTGGAGIDALSGEDGDDVIFGLGSNDVLRGHRGRDYIDGGLGHDIVDGGLDDDIVFGADGNDLLIGGGGNDHIIGGGGTDVAKYSGDFRRIRHLIRVRVHSGTRPRGRPRRRGSA